MNRRSRRVICTVHAKAALLDASANTVHRLDAVVPHGDIARVLRRIRAKRIVESACASGGARVVETRWKNACVEVTFKCDAAHVAAHVAAELLSRLTEAAGDGYLEGDVVVYVRGDSRKTQVDPADADLDDLPPNKYFEPVFRDIRIRMEPEHEYWQLTR